MVLGYGFGIYIEEKVSPHGVGRSNVAVAVSSNRLTDAWG
jgi:hypothetical protein